MRPTAFRQANGVCTAPAGMESQVQDLHVFSDGEQCISLWRATFVDRLLILLTGRVWFSSITGRTQPPVIIQAKHPFVRRTFAVWLRHALLLMGDVRSDGATPVPAWMFHWNRAVGVFTTWLDAQREHYRWFWLALAAIAVALGFTAGSTTVMGLWTLLALGSLAMSAHLIYGKERG